MPTLSRLLFVCLVLAAVVYGAMVGLVAWVKPVTADLTIDIPQSALKLRDWPDEQPQNSVLPNGNVEGVKP